MKSMFLNKEDSISIKRVCGFMGWLVCLGILIYCSAACVVAPTIYEPVLFTTTTLLGLDTITNIWKKK